MHIHKFDMGYYYCKAIQYNCNAVQYTVEYWNALSVLCVCVCV